MLGRVHSFLHTKNISLQSYMLNDNVLCQLKRSLYTVNGQDGLTDSVRTLCCNYNEHNRHILGLLLKSF